tara:strand:- start:2 stop:454 length:453 start_codon:yes stop_codon:yes gene_type:complete
MKNTTLLLLLLGFIFTSCEKENIDPIVPPNSDIFLEISSELEYNGEIYTFTYPENSPSSYFKVDYNSLPTQRVYWDSPDEFYTIMYEGSTDTTWTPVVNYSTYSDDDGTGHQMVYVNPTLIGDTLNIIGEINENGQKIYKEILVKIESYE